MTGIESCEVVVIGAGPAGLAAALGARRAGAADVLLLDREDRPGGILNQCIHDGFGLVLYRDSLTGPEYAERLVEEAVREGVRIAAGAMVLDLSADRLLRVNARTGYRLVQAGAVVLAMGCRERTRDMIGIPGTRPAGIFTAGTAQNLVNLQNLRIGRDVVVLGSGDIGLIMARRLTLEGLRVRGVLEVMPWPGGLERNVRQCLGDFGIPLRLGTTVVDIRGRDRVESVTAARVDEALRPIAGTEAEIACDTLLLSVGLIPENELARAAGVALSPLTGGAAVDEAFMTSVPGIFSCGNVLHIHDVADYASAEGFAAGAAAARFARGERPAAEPRLAVSPGPGIKYALPQSIRAGAVDVEIKFRTDRPRRGVRVEVRGTSSGRLVLRARYGRLLPSEMERLHLRGAVEEPLEIGLEEEGSRRRRAGRPPSPPEPVAASPASAAGDHAAAAPPEPDVDRLTCILCPTGCEMTVRRLGEGGPGRASGEARDAGAPIRREGLEIAGHRCDKGAAFAVEEVLHPLRNLTASVPLEGRPDRPVSVRLSGRVPRPLIFPVLAEIAKLRPAAPVRRGQVLLANVLGTGVDVVATRTES